MESWGTCATERRSACDAVVAEGTGGGVRGQVDGASNGSWGNTGHGYERDCNMESKCSLADLQHAIRVRLRRNRCRMPGPAACLV